MVRISVVHDDVLARRCDLLVLKHADSFFGVDLAVAQKIGFNRLLLAGSHEVVATSDLPVKRVMFLGVGPLWQFRYGQIRRFAAKSLGRAATFDFRCETICSPVHGPGYGLDEKESFLSLVAGFLDAIDHGHAPPHLQQIEIVERSGDRFCRLAAWLTEYLPEQAQPLHAKIEDVRGIQTTKPLASFGDESEAKPKMFVAMPFSDEYSDLYEVAIQDASQKTNIICERLLEHAYLGDIVQEIKTRIKASNGLIGVLDGHNPNVFLEIGFAWGLGKPTLLIVKENEPLPFNVQGQKSLTYNNIGNLRSQLIGYLEQLKLTGTFGKSP
jgi:hypothetical protein